VRGEREREEKARTVAWTGQQSCKSGHKRSEVQFLMGLERLGSAAIWCLLATGLIGAAPAGSRTFSEALRPLMHTLLVGVIAFLALVVLGALVVASLKRTNQQGSESRSFGQAGWFTYMMSLKRAGLALLCLAPLLVVSMFFKDLLGRSTLPGAMLALMVVCMVAFKLIAKRSDQAERGADAEVAVAQLLRTLPKEYYVFHDLAFEGFNIDHVVIGPTGVFTVETKSHRGKVSAGGEALRLNGRPFEKPILNQAWSEAFSLRDRLPQIAEIPCRVQPILCFPNAFIDVRGLVKGVIVTNRQFLLRVITGRRTATLSQPDILQLVNALKLSTSSVPLGRG